jgi:PP-loop superfamily ATP-utilizing enzyme
MQKVTAAVPPGSEQLLATFLADIKVALAMAIGETFLIGAGMMALSFVAMLFVVEIPLVSRPKLDTVEAIATELGIEESVVPVKP